MLRVVVLLAMVRATRASECCMTAQFDAIEYFQEGIDLNNQPHIIEGSAAVSLDSARKMTNRFVTTSTDGGDLVQSRIIEDYGKTMMLYTVTEKGSKCVKTPLTSNWTGVCIPDGSPKGPPVHYGMAAKLDIDTYLVPLKAEPMLKVYWSVSRADCTIVTETISGAMTKGGVPIMMVIGLYNATAGIRDPTVFDIPASCSGAKLNDANYRIQSSICPHYHNRDASP